MLATEAFLEKLWKAHTDGKRVWVFLTAMKMLTTRWEEFRLLCLKSPPFRLVFHITFRSMTVGEGTAEDQLGHVEKRTD